MRFGRKCSLPRFRYLLIASTDTVLAISRVPLSADTTGERQHRYGGIGADAKSRRRITWGCAAFSIAQPAGNAAGDQPPGLPSLHRLCRQMPESSCTPVSSASGLRSAHTTYLRILDVILHITKPHAANPVMIPHSLLPIPRGSHIPRFL